MNTNPSQKLILIETKTFGDDRGYFRETWRSSLLSEMAGKEVKFCQGNESLNVRAGVVRGLHFQLFPAAQAKLVRVNYGAVYDVALDLRVKSPTFGKWQGFELSADNGTSLYIPEGFAHGFCTLEDNTVLSYQVTAYYAPELESGIRWDDPDLAIDWPLPPGGALISPKDAIFPLLSETDKKKLFF